MESIGTKAEEAKVKGKSSGKVMSCATSGLGADRPTMAMNQLRAKAKNNMTATPAMNPGTEVVM